MDSHSDKVADYVIYPPPQAGPGDDPRSSIWFNVSHVVVDHNVQRTTLQSRVDDLNASFDFNKAEAITITVREDGTMAVTEGQTRVLSRRETHPGSHMWGVVSSDSHEAGVALGIAKGRKALTAYDKWRLRHHERDPRVLAAEQVLAFMDPPLQLTDRLSGNIGYGIFAIGAMDRVMAAYPEDVAGSALLLKTILQVLTTAWPNSRETRRLDGRLIDSLRHVIVRNGDIIDVDRLTETMQSMTPHRWCQYAADRGAADTASSAIGREIVRVYNYRKQSRRIEL